MKDKIGLCAENINANIKTIQGPIDNVDGKAYVKQFLE
jgi:hypothetical protein